jgi:hypothetical protein
MEVSLFRKGLVDCNQGKERKMAIAQENLEKQWENIQPQLLDEYGEGTYTSWIKPLTFMDMKNGCFRLAAPTSFVRDWVKSNYATRMQTLLQGKNDNSFKLDIIVAPQQNVQEISSSTSTLDASDIGSNLDPRFTFDNFVVGKPNELAHAAALKVAESETVAFNPLFLYGGVGLGKTHLMHAIAWQIKKCHPKRRVIYLSAEKFMYQFVRALRFKDTVSFKEQFRSVDVLMIDDVQFIGGKESTQEEFFHTFNALVDQNRQIIFNPSWHVPASIIHEILPKIEHNPEAYARKGYVVTNDDSGTHVVQRPGSANALGKIRFTIESPFSIYLHGTPSQNLFKKENRSLSHGCIRVENPVKLAKFVFDDPSWTLARIENKASGSQTDHVKLSHSLPVFITYFTVFEDEHGKMNFVPDEYGQDEKVWVALEQAKRNTNKEN